MRSKGCNRRIQNRGQNSSDLIKETVLCQDDAAPYRQKKKLLVSNIHANADSAVKENESCADGHLTPLSASLFHRCKARGSRYLWMVLLPQ